MADKKSIVVIGGGPGGYVAAIRAAQLGARVTLVEKDRLGGTCLNAGCIPTKVLLHTVEMYKQVREASAMGIKVGQAEVDWKALMKRKEAVVGQLVSGVEGLLMINGVDTVEGTASFIGPKEIEVIESSGARRALTADAFIIAVGSESFVPPIDGVDLPGVITSTGALSLDEVPESMVIIGGGVIGVELATVYSGLGCNVTILEMMPEILPNMDGELVGILRSILEQGGIKIYTGAKVTSISLDAQGLNVGFWLEGKEMKAAAQKVLVSVGRRPNIEGLNLEGIGIAVERGGIKVDERLQTNIEGIYAVGDCTGGIMLAHVASYQGVIAVENIMGLKKSADYKTVPGCVYTQPELAGVGLTEREAVEKGYSVKVGRFPLEANGKSVITGQTAGMVKIITDTKYDEILGVHILGPRATDLIAEGALALRLEATTEELVSTIHAHPTVAEAVMEAALAVDNIAVHIPNIKGQQ